MMHSTYDYVTSSKSEFINGDVEEQKEAAERLSQIHKAGQEDKTGIFSYNFFGEILFDYLLTHYENNIYYVG
jgi:hypothetical protein